MTYYIDLKSERMKKLTVLLLGILIIALFSSCSKRWDDIPGQSETSSTPAEQEITALGDMQAPANFDWKTVKDIEITISANSNGLVEASSPNGVTYQRAYLNSDQEYTMKLTVPTYERSINLKKDNRSESISITSSKVIFSFN